MRRTEERKQSTEAGKETAPHSREPERLGAGGEQERGSESPGAQPESQHLYWALELLFFFLK